MNLITAKLLRTVTVSGGTLYEIAARELGDPLQWVRIARLNGLSDPYLDGRIRKLKIPPYDPKASNGGILV